MALFLWNVDCQTIVVIPLCCISARAVGPSGGVLRPAVPGAVSHLARCQPQGHPHGEGSRARAHRAARLGPPGALWHCGQEARQP